MHVSVPSKIKTPSSIIADTGTGVHLIGLKHVRGKDRNKIRDNGDEVILSTANGRVNAVHKIDLYSQRLGEELEAVVLDKTPTALSVGRLCLDGDWEMVWRNKRNPYLKKPGSQPIELPVNNYVPYLKCNNRFSALATGSQEINSPSQSSSSDDSAGKKSKEDEAARLFGEDDEEDDESQNNKSKEKITRRMNLLMIIRRLLSNLRKTRLKNIQLLIII